MTSLTPLVGPSTRLYRRRPALPHCDTCGWAHRIAHVAIDGSTGPTVAPRAWRAIYDTWRIGPLYRTRAEAIADACRQKQADVADEKSAWHATRMILNSRKKEAARA